MVSASAPVYRVRVRGNLVVSIRPVPRPPEGQAPVFADRLSVSTRLAENNQANGCFDGDYHVEDFEMARHFAALCLGYMKTLCETSLAAIAAIEADAEGAWINPHLPRPPES